MNGSTASCGYRVRRAGLNRDAVIKDLLITVTDGKRNETKHDNLADIAAPDEPADGVRSG